MHFQTIALLALPILSHSVAAKSDSYFANFTVYTDDNCQGNADIAYTLKSSSYCFNTPGKSFGSFSMGPKADNGWKCDVITYSEQNCDGTCALYSGDGQKTSECGQTFDFVPGYGDCVNIPFNAAQLSCLYYD